MKTLFAACIFFCLTTISSAAEQATSVYDGAVLTEDVTWRGSILVRGFVVVAPQATLRIEPGTVVRFAAICRSAASEPRCSGSSSCRWNLRAADCADV